MRIGAEEFRSLVYLYGRMISTYSREVMKTMMKSKFTDKEASGLFHFTVGLPSLASLPNKRE